MRAPLCERPEHAGCGTHGHAGEPGPWLWSRDPREAKRLTTGQQDAAMRRLTAEQRA